MPTIRNVSPLGALDVALLRRTVPAGAEVEVSDEHARRLLAQPENYQPADDAARALAAELAVAAETDDAEQPLDEDSDREGSSE